MSKSHYIIPIFVPNEGCPHKCVFCNQETITGSHNKVDGDFVRKIIEEYLQTIRREDSIIEVSFFGGTFTAIPMEKQSELLQVAKEYKDKGIIDYIHMSTRPDYINERILDNLKKYSADIIELGVQSLDEKVLKASGRGHSVEDVYEASKLIKKYGFTLGHQIMLGLPYDTFKKDIETTKKVIENKPDICRIYPALVIKNTPMEKMYIKGDYKPYTLNEALDTAEVVYGMLVANRINVIRIGLQPTDEINLGGDLVSGPFHPAFRELVESKILNTMILSECLQNTSKEVLIKINNKDISKLYANKKKFFNDMKKQLKTTNIKVIQQDTIERNTVVVFCDGKCNILSLYEFMIKNYKEGKF